MMQATKIIAVFGTVGAMLAATASPSLARTHHVRTQQPAPYSAPYTAFGAVPFAAPSYGRVEGRTPRSNDVYDNGRYVGSDPDQFIRDSLRRDHGDN